MTYRTLALILLAAPAFAGPPDHRMARDCFDIGNKNGRYQLVVNGEAFCADGAAVCRVCVPPKGVYTLRITDGDKASTDLLIERVGDFDADGDGRVTFADFTYFAADHGKCQKPNGEVGECE